MNHNYIFIQVFDRGQNWWLNHNIFLNGKTKHTVVTIHLPVISFQKYIWKDKLNRSTRGTHVTTQRSDLCVTHIPVGERWEDVLSPQPFCGSLFLRWLVVRVVYLLDSSHNHHYDKNRQEKRQHEIRFRITWNYIHISTIQRSPDIQEMWRWNQWVMVYWL